MSERETTNTMSELDMLLPKNTGMQDVLDGLVEKCQKGGFDAMERDDQHMLLLLLTRADSAHLVARDQKNGKLLNQVRSLLVQIWDTIQPAMVSMGIRGGGGDGGGASRGSRGGAAAAAAAPQVSYGQEDSDFMDEPAKRLRGGATPLTAGRGRGGGGGGRARGGGGGRARPAGGGGRGGPAR